MAPLRGFDRGKAFYSVFMLFIHFLSFASEIPYLIHQVYKEVAWHWRRRIDLTFVE